MVDDSGEKDTYEARIKKTVDILWICWWCGEWRNGVNEWFWMYSVKRRLWWRPRRPLDELWRCWWWVVKICLLVELTCVLKNLNRMDAILFSLVRLSINVEIMLIMSNWSLHKRMSVSSVWDWLAASNLKMDDKFCKRNHPLTQRLMFFFHLVI